MTAITAGKTGRRGRGLFGIVALTVVAARPGLAADPGGPTRTIAVSGQGEVRVPPDVAIVNLGVRASAPTVRQAMSQARDRMQQLLAAMAGLGLPEKDLATSRFSLFQEQPRPGEKGAVVYHADTMLEVRIHDLDLVDAVLEAGTAAGANQVWGLDFVVDDPDRALGQARQLALAQARAKAEQLAGLHGCRLGRVQSIAEEAGASVPMARAMALEAKAAGLTTPGEQTVGVRLQVVYGIE